MIATVTLAFALMLGPEPPPAAPVNSSWGNAVKAKAAGSAVLLNLGHSESQAIAGMAVPAAERLVEYQRAAMCNTSSAMTTTPLNGACPAAEGDAGVNDCGGDTPLLPMWARDRPNVASQTWSAWYQVDAGGCPADILPVLTVEDFRRLPLAPPVLNLQPDRGWVLVNKETIVSTERTEQTFRTELLGHGIDVIATPDTFTYDFGDDTDALVTRSAGHPWPDHDTFHFYEELGTVQITLTTTWKGQYRVDGTTQWRDVVGTAETTVTSAPFTVEERRSRLVSSLCTDIPKPDDCD
ncbi:hypothetical protein [Cellulomonas xylanilytica]|uniref:PKD domain-containing protein n=1 Tax=Cellulomonas xylanilytica TaxID=233583 RepID=A0A510VDT3_9CELL|nr:hypothetical protein [Cellulomonas xylanilytica]GEK23295.1 hypothetical protein CXY01_38150 [Cellulomonas xylanilytica]